MSPICYLLDENVNLLFRRELQRREPTLVIWRVGTPGAPPNGTLDPEILCWCEDHDFILVTNNGKSIPQHLKDHLAAGRHVPGIFELNDNLTIDATIEELLLIWAAGDVADYRDKVSYMPII